MPYKDPEKKRAYHREYQRQYQYTKKLQETPEGQEKLKQMRAKARYRWLERKDLPIEVERRKLTESRRYQKHRDQRLRESRNRELLTKYGISLLDYHDLVLQQEGRCAICQNESHDGKGLRVDHCHKTKTVRGLLCHQCNVGIGLLRDDPVRLRNAAQYLERSS